MRIAVIGTGISGLGTAWLLNRKHQVHVFEANEYVGGHARTITVRQDGEEVALDTGFIVYNTSTYPHLVRLFELLGVATQPADISFSLRCERCDLEYSDKSLLAVFAQKRNLLRPSFLRMLADILRFNRLSSRLLESGTVPRVPLGVFLRKNSFGADFANHYLVPLASALWSSGPEAIGRVPTSTLMRFFFNHGLLRVRDRPEWRNVSGGSRNYVQALIRDFKDRIHTGKRVVSVTRSQDQVRLGFAGGGAEVFDHVVMATHADEALALLRDPSDREKELLSPWSYLKNEAWLHTDESQLPQREAAVASLNYWLPDCTVPARSVTVSYNLTRLQGLRGSRHYIETLNPVRPPAERHVIECINFRHPIFTPESVATQADLPSLNGQRRTFFCGVYFGYGRHEDGLASAVRVGEHLQLGMP